MEIDFELNALKYMSLLDFWVCLSYCHLVLTCFHYFTIEIQEISELYESEQNIEQALFTKKNQLKFFKMKRWQLLRTNANKKLLNLLLS